MQDQANEMKYNITSDHIRGTVGAEYFPPWSHGPPDVGIWREHQIPDHARLTTEISHINAGPQTAAIRKSAHYDNRAENIPPLQHHHHYQVALENIVRGS